MAEASETPSLRVPSPDAPAPEEVTITFDDTPVTARRGETIAAALTAAGIREFRQTTGNATRGIFCGMGVCQECLVDVDGRANRRACMTPVTGPNTVRSGSPRQAIPSTAPQTPVQKEPITESPEVLVIGAGAAGLTAAATAAEAGCEVVVLDERPGPGGQYFKQPASIYTSPGSIGTDRQFESGRQLIERARKAGVRIVSGAEVWGAFTPLEITAVTPQGAATYRPQRLIVATGAYERSLPVPGWTLPGVMTTGAAQTLLRSYRTLPGKRVLIAGNGPLNMQVGAELARGGANVVGIAEAADLSFSRALSAGRMAMAAPDLCREGLVYLAELRHHGIPLHRGAFILRVDAVADGLQATLGTWRDGKAQPVLEVDADVVCMGYGFMPSNEVLRLLDADHSYDSGRGQLVTRRDNDCRTSLDGVFAIGDCCGLGGARAAMDDGIIAGLTAATEIHGGGAKHKDMMEKARRRRDRQRRFQKALWEVFAAPRLATELCEPDTLICRCEEVSHRMLRDSLEDEPEDIGSLKRCTRAGMGRCQGRYCASNLAAMIAEKTGRPLEERSFFAPRPPIKPITVSDIATVTDSPVAPPELED